MKTSQNVQLRDLFGGVTYKIFYFVNVINASPRENSRARLIWIIRVFGISIRCQKDKNSQVMGHLYYEQYKS